MSSKEIKIIEARINEELDNIDSLTEELSDKNLYGAVADISEDTFFLRGIASILHDFYVAIENTLKIICLEIDENLPEGTHWHLLLLKQASYEIPEVRPAIISKETMRKLDKYRAFRHLFRNVYGFNLESSRIEELLLELPAAIDSFKNDLNRFLKLLDQADNFGT